MSQSAAIPPSSVSPAAATGAATRLHGRWLFIARALWLLLAVLNLVIFFGSLPLFLAELQTPCDGTACVYFQLTPRQVQSLQGLGWSRSDYAALLVALWLVSFGVTLGVSTLIVWRRSQDRMAMLVALMLAMQGPPGATSSVGAGTLLWQVVANQSQTFLSPTLSLLVFLLFPSGQFVPRWSRWILVVNLGAEFPLIFFLALPSSNHAGFLVFLGTVVVVAFLQLYRYRRVSTLVQRQQTKWVVFGFVAPITVLAILVVLGFVPVLAEPGSLYPLMIIVTSNLLLLGISLSFGIAMLRYRLWDIDALINKALVYGVLTVLLGGLYAGLIIGLESLAGLIAGPASSNPVVLVISTLVIAVLFLPVRRRIQALIDRRFFRKKYDAEKVLAAFSATLRQETNLEQIRESLLVVVQETMQPAHVSLWLRTPSWRETSALQGSALPSEEATGQEKLAGAGG